MDMGVLPMPKFNLGWDQKVIFFVSLLGNLAYKINGNEAKTPCKQIFCPFTHPRPLGGVKSKKKPPEMCNVAYQIKRKEMKKQYAS